MPQRDGWNQSFVVDKEEIGQIAAKAREGSDITLVAGQLTPALINELSSRIGPVVFLSALDPQDVPYGSCLLRDDGSLVAYDHVGQYGVNVLTLGVDPQSRSIVHWNYQAISLPRSAAVSSDVQKLLDDFYSSNATSFAPADALFGWDEGISHEYAGSQACQGCHEREYVQWKATPHATAYETLTRVRRNLQPKCVVCHVVGLGESTGFDLRRPTP